MTTASYPKHQAALVYARAMLGVHEVPAGSNRGPIQRTNPVGGVDFFEAHDFLAGTGYPWCVSFLDSCWAVGANHPLPYPTAGAYDLYAWAQKAGWTLPVARAIPGDLLVWNIGSGHASMLEELADGQVHSIDGNHSNEVGRAIRPSSLLRGAIHVPETPAKPAPAVPKPYWLIVTDENGKRVVVFSKFATEKTIAGLLPRLATKFGKTGFTIKRGGTRKPTT